MTKMGRRKRHILTLHFNHSGTVPQTILINDRLIVFSTSPSTQFLSGSINSSINSPSSRIPHPAPPSDGG